MALGATFTVAGFDGVREIPSGEFFAPDGIRKNVLRRGDLITRITLPEGAERRRSGYAKLRLRDSFDFPDAGVAAALLMDGDVVEDLQIAVSAVSMTPLLFPEATARATGEKLTGDLIRALADDIAARCKPVKNVMFPPQYRKQMVGLYTRRLLTRLARPARD
jgi:CO/xanthine dehydrogenase FAD-binding subunit